MIPSPKIALAGSVGSSHRTLQALIRHGLEIAGVLGLGTQKSAQVSDYHRLDDLAAAAGVPYYEFNTINQPDVIQVVRTWAPDLLFVVGLSQLVGPELLAIPRFGCVGFHPTWLPQGRGRAPVAWLTLEGKPGAATFFLMDEGADSGPILAQEPFFVSDQDYAADVMAKLEAAIDRALDRWLPALRNGEWAPAPQEHSLATFYGRRSPEDGLIQWEQPARQIHALVRAASHPHPGAYTYAGNSKLVIWQAEIEPSDAYHGVVGRIIHVDPAKGWLVQTGEGALWITQAEFAPTSKQEIHTVLRVGVKLGYTPQDEVFVLRRRVEEMERRLAKLETLVPLDGDSTQ